MRCGLQTVVVVALVLSVVAIASVGAMFEGYHFRARALSEHEAPVGQQLVEAGRGVGFSRSDDEGAGGQSDRIEESLVVQRPPAGEVGEIAPYEELDRLYPLTDGFRFGGSRIPAVEVQAGQHQVGVLMQFRGPSTRVANALHEPIAFGGIPATPENIRAVDKLLSSQGVAYNIARNPVSYWTGATMTVVVGAKDFEVTATVLKAGVNGEWLGSSPVYGVERTR